MPSQTQIRDEVTARIIQALEADLLPGGDRGKPAPPSPVGTATSPPGSRTRA